jgi:hypothetical protein
MDARGTGLEGTRPGLESRTRLQRERELRQNGLRTVSTLDDA